MPWFVATRPSTEQQLFLRALYGWSESLKANDRRRLTALYARDAVRYEARTSLRTIGADSIGWAWEVFLRQLPKRSTAETTDVNYYIARGLAYAHFLVGFPIHASDQGEARWLCVTQGFGVDAGEWKIFHEHVTARPNPTPDQQWVIRGPSPAE